MTLTGKITSIIVKVVYHLLFFSYTSKEKYLLVEILKELFGKTKINNISLFFNIYSFLLFEVYDHKHHKGSSSI